jgi:subtilisin family serine protease
MVQKNKEKDIKIEETDIEPNMDPKLQRIIQKSRGKAKQRPHLVSTSDTGEEVIDVILKLKDPDVPVEGLKIRTVVGQIVTGSIPISKIEDVRRHENVLSMKAPVQIRESLDAAVPEIHADSSSLSKLPSGGLDGSNIIIGIVDYGCDFNHKDFRNEDGTSRILFLWDQAGGPNPKSPEVYKYGREFSKADLDRALEDKFPIDYLDYYLWAEAHGTHVMGIAAGNGRAVNRYFGVAPKADIIFVDADINDISWKGPEVLDNSFGDSIKLCEAVNYIFEKAAELNRPAVVNISLGTNGGPHDGTSLVEQYFDKLLESNNRAIVIAASNSYEDGIHTCGRIEQDQPVKLEWEIGSNDITDNELEIWYNREDELEVELINPEKKSLGRVPLGKSFSSSSEGKEVVLVAHRQNDPNNHDNNIDIFFSGNFGFGKWSVILHPVKISNGTFHAWIERDDGGQSSFSSNTSKPCHTVGSISTGKLPIIVGSYDPRDPDRTISSFSSAGPTRDGREKPEISAPGDKIWSAKSRSQSIVEMSGTSMAAPAITGTIALLMQAAKEGGKDLGIQQIREIITATARKLPPSEGIFDFRYGNGRIDAFEAAKAIEVGTPVVTPGEIPGTIPVIPVIRQEIKPGVKIPFGSIKSSMKINENKQIKDIKVGVDITHSFIGDLTLDLISPGGSSVRLHDREGGWRDNIIKTYTILDTPVLNDFIGENSGGDWVLNVADLDYLSQGNLNKWSLEIKF